MEIVRLVESLSALELKTTWASFGNWFGRVLRVQRVPWHCTVHWLPVACALNKLGKCTEQFVYFWTPGSVIFSDYLCSIQESYFMQKSKKRSASGLWSISSPESIYISLHIWHIWYQKKIVNWQEPHHLWSWHPEYAPLPSVVEFCPAPSAVHAVLTMVA